ncbi:MAG: 50S ribosomal protein L35 [Oscillospiraceae bacterium]|nr:50S ribosomal protein L35 [Oscillospiraceae bacterium]
MNKIKTHKSAEKRFSFTKTGKIKYMRQNRRHQVHLKDTKRIRHLKKGAYISEANADAIKKLMPYS